jgi:hypothetical protein
MNRRTVIKNLAFVIGAATLMPSCMKGEHSASIPLKKIAINGDQEDLISEICETIIPKTTTPGSKDLKLHLFVLKMVDDCYKKKDQQAFMTGLDQFKDLIQKKYNKSFIDLSNTERESALLDIEKSNKVPPINGGKPQKLADVPPLMAFYGVIKQQTLTGYTQSQYFMTKQIVYELVPGRWNAHYPASKVNEA